MFLIRIDKCLQAGDISEVVDNYATPKEEKNANRLFAQALENCERLGAHRMPFAWTFVDVFKGARAWCSGEQWCFTRECSLVRFPPCCAVMQSTTQDTTLTAENVNSMCESSVSRASSQMTNEADTGTMRPKRDLNMPCSPMSDSDSIASMERSHDFTRVGSNTSYARYVGLAHRRDFP